MLPARGAIQVTSSLPPRCEIMCAGASAACPHWKEVGNEDHRGWQEVAPGALLT